MVDPNEAKDGNVDRNDIFLAAKIIQNLDARLGMQEEELLGASAGSEEGKEADGRSGRKKRTEEADGRSGGDSGGGAGGAGGGAGVARDDELIDVLDRLLFYLRVVHSVDYYNHCKYPNEYEMPNR